MDLAIVSPYPPDITGIGQYGYHVSRSLAQSGQFSQVHVLAGARRGSPPSSKPSTMKVSYAWQPGHYDAGAAIVSRLRANPPDLVWFNIGASVFGRSPLANLLGFLSLCQVRLSGIPVVVTLHELVELADLKTLNAPGGRLAVAGARLLTRMATCSDVVCVTLRGYARWFSVQRPNLTCVHIPIGAYQAPERLPESTDPELLFFGTLAPYKGIDVLLTAYQTLLERNPDLRLTIAGAAHPRFPGYLESLRRAHAHLPGVRWLGQVPEDQMRSLFERARIVILPYLASTGSSSVLYQAAMWSRPLIASDLPEIRSLCEENGLKAGLFATRSPTGLAGAVQEMLDSPERCRAQVDHNFAAIQRRRPEATCLAYLHAFNLALAARRSPKRIDIPAFSPTEFA